MWCIPEVSNVTAEGLGNCDKMDPVRTPLILIIPVFVHSVLFAFSSLHHFLPYKLQRHCHTHHKNKTSPNDLSPIASFPGENSGKCPQRSQLIHGSVLSQYITPSCPKVKTFSLRDFHFSISLNSFVLTCLHLFLG